MSLTLKPAQQSQALSIHSDKWPSGPFIYTLPEAVGSTRKAVWGAAPETLIAPTWEPADGGGWSYDWRKEGVLAFSVKAAPSENHVDVTMHLTNLGPEPWPGSFAFNCLNPSRVLEFGDYDGARTYLLLDGEWKPITSVARVHSRRPTIQLWYVEGQPRPLDFVEAFQATPELYPKGVLAVRAYNGKDVIGVTADKPFFLFSNLEFSCIHCSPSFGALEPGEEGHALSRFFAFSNTTMDLLEEKIAFLGA
jgi:hypothetical protein